MECCILVFVIIIIVVLAVFGSKLLVLIGAILPIIYSLLLNSKNWIKRIFWSKPLVDLPYSQLIKTSEELETHLRELMSADKELSEDFNSKDEVENFVRSLKIEATKAGIDDTQTKINILKGVIKKKQPQHDIRLAKQKARREKELKELTSTSEYKLIEQFAKKNPGSDSKVELLKLQVLLESKGWDITSDELINLVRRENNKHLQEDLVKFASSTDYKLIEQYVNENRDKENTAGLTKLQLLLENKGWHIPSDELMNFVRIEGDKQRLDNAKAIILMNNPESREEILKSYLSNYKPNDFELRALEGILEERNLSYPDLDDLLNVLDKMKTEVELEQFERNLLDENKAESS
ncbi:MAG TPA: hypothetical protein VK892_20110 [Pyrinomonadaceae bacterium]|nr:hypothetical protein [Pyrinomonadaceae bacterium]